MSDKTLIHLDLLQLVYVRYQIAIMCAITASVAITAFLILLQGYRSYFTPADQLRQMDSRF